MLILCHRYPQTFKPAVEELGLVAAWHSIYFYTMRVPSTSIIPAKYLASLLWRKGNNEIRQAGSNHTKESSTLQCTLYSTVHTVLSCKELLPLTYIIHCSVNEALLPMFPSTNERKRRKPLEIEIFLILPDQ